MGHCFGGAVPRLPQRRATGWMPQASTPSSQTYFERGQNYWTVTVPFMFKAACGVQMLSYLPGGIFAKETV
jgi:hypothetical protein